jgi:hypothetical protein
VQVSAKNIIGEGPKSDIVIVYTAEGSNGIVYLKILFLKIYLVGELFT